MLVPKSHPSAQQSEEKTTEALNYGVLLSWEQV